MKLVNGSFFAPNYIFIKDNLKLSDEQLFEKLGLENYELISDEEEKENGIDKRYSYVTEDEKWKHLMDDWLYTLWFDKEIRNKIEILSKDFDIFCCSFSDDDSFEFVYYKNGIKKRKYLVGDLNYDDGTGERNFGKALEIEEVALSKVDCYETILIIAESLGINIHHDLDRIRCYGRDEKESEKFVFDEDEY